MRRLLVELAISIINRPRPREYVGPLLSTKSLLLQLSSALSIMSGIKIVFGAFSVQPNFAFGDPKVTKQLFSLLKEHGVTTLDTAEIYGESESTLGAIDAGASFTVDTKSPGGFIKGRSGADIVSGAKASLKRLHMSQVDVFYMHSPDASIPLEETLEAINEIHKAGLFKRFGLSNYKAEDVRKAHALAKEKGWVLPTVYQGNFSAAARLQETLLFPTLRELGIAFYAYSPVAGGFLSKTRAQVEANEGRFNPNTDLGKMYISMYSKPPYLKALDEWNDIAKEVGCSPGEMANRWVSYNSPLSRERGDAIIIGGRNLETIEGTLKGLENGPLPQTAVKRIDAMWETIKHEAPLDNYNR